MIFLTSECPHDQGVKHSMAHDRWHDAPALPAAQTVDNASNHRSAVASVKLAGQQPSQHLETLLASWIDGNSTLDQVQASLLAKVRPTDD